MREITMEEAVEAIKNGNGYYSPYAHAPIVGTTNFTVIFVGSRFFYCGPQDFALSVKEVLRFDRGSMIVAHGVECNNSELGGLLTEEIQRITAQTQNEPWAQEFREHTNPKVVFTPPRKKHWYNRYYVEPHERDD